MKSFIHLITFLVTICHFQFADAASDVNVYGWTTGVQLTGYSAACKHDSYGGPNTSKSGMKPRSHTLDGDSKIILVAVPQSGGTGNLYGCSIEFQFEESSVPEVVQKLFEGRTVYAGDVYGAGSNGKKKFDISLECTKQIQFFNFKGVKARKIACGKKP